MGDVPDFIKDAYIGAVVGGALYDIVAELVEKLTSKLGLDVDLAVLVATYFLSQKYPQYKALLAGVGAVAASHLISLKGLMEGHKTATTTAQVSRPSIIPYRPIKPGVIRVF